MNKNDLSGDDPYKLFSLWYAGMASEPVGDPSAMILSTASADGRVSSRVVLMKDYSEEGFVFFTNYMSRKAQQLDSNSQASLLFYWPLQKRQVRVEGYTSKVTEAESDAYFLSRPAESRLGAWASEQSREIESREVLERRMEEFRSRFGTNIPRMPQWGGYRLYPDLFEFWQEGDHRLHDRLVFTKNGESWRRSRLAP
jgi:pyridoxamine 5'-phosphate oxidase